MDSEEISKRLVNRSRRKLLLLAAISVLPLIVAYVLYYGGWRPTSTGNHGELVQPAHPVGDAEFVSVDGPPYRLSALRGRWVLITFSPRQCEVACQGNLYKMQQVRLTQGRDAPRVERLLILTDAPAATLRDIALRYPGLLAVSAVPATLQKLAREFEGGQELKIEDTGRVYLIDPIGNLVMRYAPDADPTGMRKDLARMLRLSQVG